MSGFAGFEPLRRNRWFDDGDAAATTKREDDLVQWSWDWGDILESGDTVASAAYVDSGTTRTNVALATPVTSADVAGLGEFEVTVTTTNGQKHQRVFRFYSSAGRAVTSDYT